MKLYSNSNEYLQGLENKILYYVKKIRYHKTK